jgi:hypothetical protein
VNALLLAPSEKMKLVFEFLAFGMISKMGLG